MIGSPNRGDGEMNEIQLLASFIVIGIGLGITALIVALTYGIWITTRTANKYSRHMDDGEDT